MCRFRGKNGELLVKTNYVHVSGKDQQSQGCDSGLWALMESITYEN